MKRFRALLILLTAAALTVQAAVKPADIFSDGLVLQRGEPVNIWGTADSSEEITVEFAGQKKTTEAGADGKWLITLDPLQGSEHPRELIFYSFGNRQSAIKNVLVGEVWLAGGQSNMATTMQTYKRKTQPDIDRAQDDLLRFCTIPQNHFPGHNKGQRPEWLKTNPETVKGFSGTAYYFAKELRKHLDVPVGIIVCATGGTPAEAWMSRKTLDSKPELKRTIDAYDRHVTREFPTDADYEEALKEYNRAKKEYTRLREAGKKVKKPREVMGPRNFKRPCGLHENMLTQTIPFTVKGVIWYQGENNASQKAGLHYRTVFSTLIEEWRSEFGKPELPFFFCQLATLGWGDDSHWPELRDAQQWVADHVPNTGIAILLDGGEKTDIHPHSKDIAGYRLGLLARNKIYGEKGLCAEGPRFKKVDFQGRKAVISFADTNLVLRPGGENTFELAGKDGVFKPASAELKNGKIILTAEDLPVPAYVRYGWRKWVTPTLYNREGLPAGPFRSDDLPMASAGGYFLDWVE
ncbi:sialate O-acetylesterase [Pontiella agarivorans]|uniref:Sialate O-acetylesterase n=1 Tax=Pontiella agarivorans TaxID=3038953 RepID=A0ABU5MTT2_9BACT|nr:sialate O-acetylesterase [Pontiella agarivorans]MDZ8117634.1 sialate O-acetylesterase [Pontiella agarivorans]